MFIAAVCFIFLIKMCLLLLFYLFIYFLPQLLLGDQTALLTSMPHATPFSARALQKKKENIFFDVDIVVKNKSKCGLA